MRKVRKYIAWLLLGIMGIFLLVFVVLNLPFTQHFATQKVNQILRRSDLPVHLGSIRKIMPGSVGLQGILIQDTEADTILFVGELQADIRLLSLMRSHVMLKDLVLDASVVDLSRDISEEELNIARAFQKGNAGITPSREKSPPKWKITIRKGVFSNIHFRMNDTLSGIRIVQQASDIELGSFQAAIAERELFCRSLLLSGADGMVKLTPRLLAPNEKSASPWNVGFQKLSLEDVDFSFGQPDKGINLESNIGKGTIKADKLDLESMTAEIDNIAFTNTDFSFFSGSDPALLLSEIELNLGDLYLDPEQMEANIKKITFDMPNGFSLKKLSGELSSARDTTLLALELRTENSQIELHGAADKGLLEIATDPEDTGLAQLHINPSRISLKDLSCFIDGMDSLVFYEPLSGSHLDVEAGFNLKGSVADISECTVSQKGNFILTLAGNINKPFQMQEITGDINFGLSEVDPGWLEKFAIRAGFSRAFPDLSGLKLAGNLSDSLQSPQISLTLESNLGNLALAGSINLRDELYLLHSSFTSIALGEILQLEDIGSFSGYGEIKGRGFSKADLNTAYYFQIDTLGFKEYDYVRTQLTGTIEPGAYTLQMVANDSSLKGDITAGLYLADSTYLAELSGIFQAGLHDLNLYDKDLTVTTRIEASMNYNGNELGIELNTKDMTFESQEESAVLKNLVVNLRTDSAATLFHAEADFFNADLNIDKPIEEIDSLGKGYWNYFLSFKDPSHLTAKDRVSGLPETNAGLQLSKHELINFFIEDSTLDFNDLELSITKKSNEKSLFARLDLDDASFRMVQSGKLSTVITDSAGIIHLDLLSDSTSLFSGPDYKWRLHGEFTNRSTLTTLSVDDNRDQNMYLIEVEGKVDSSRLTLDIPSRMLTLNANPWQLESSDLLLIDLENNKFYPSLKMNSGPAGLHLSSYEESASIGYSLDLDQVGIESLFRTNILSGSPEGTFTGSVDFSIDRDSLKTLKTGMRISDLRFSGEKLNDVRLDGGLSWGRSGHYEIDVDAQMDSIDFRLTGSRSEPDDLNLEGLFSNIPVVTLGPFTDNYLSDLGGSISGNLHISSRRGQEDFTGSLMFHDVSLKVNMLNSAFRIPSQQIEVADERMVFNDFRVLDTLNRPLNLNGFLDFSDRKEILADLVVSSSKIQVMSRDKTSKAPFTGNVYTDSRVTIKGPLLNPRIGGRIRLSEGTEIFYQQMEDLRMTETERIVTFTDYTGTEVDSEVSSMPNAGKLMRTSIETLVQIDPSTRIHFTLSKRMYDILMTVQGGGNIQYSMKNERMTLAGKYEIGSGTTLLKLVGWPNKSFTLAEGGYISWDGVIENPDLSVQAESKVSTSYVNPIDNKSRNIDIFVILRLSGSLSDLDVLFTIRTPDQYVMSIINTLSPEEQMRQAISVLLFEVIDLPGISSSTDYMTQQVNQIISSQLNQFTSSAIKGVDISFGLNTYDQNRTAGSNGTNTSLSYDVSKSLLNNRAQIEVSGRFNDDNRQAGSSDHSLNNVSFEYQLDSAASKYLKVYNEHTYDDVFEGEVIRTGIGFKYRKTYKSFRDIWRRKK